MIGAGFAREFQLKKPATLTLSCQAAMAGFTILEVVIVLSITVLMVGAAAPALTGMVRAEQLKSPARNLEAMAITARCNALAEQRPYQIVITPKGFHLERATDTPGTKPLASFALSKSISFEMAHWPEEKWLKPNRYVWYFAPSGLSDPIRVMFRKGDSYFSQKYSAITGWDQEESSFFQ